MAVYNKEHVDYDCLEYHWKLKLLNEQGFWFKILESKSKKKLGLLIRGLFEQIESVKTDIESVKTDSIGLILKLFEAEGLDEEVKRHFWEDLDEMVRGIPHTEKLFIGRNFKGHIRVMYVGYDDVHGGFGFGDRNGGGTSLLHFARAFDLVIANSSFPKKREHLVTF
uniref:Craniofacial development protein 2-like n=1 Tax=Nicotiana tabacum TaxID=4097 RepID=A0A1S4B1K8_TOBAC|nr:PREDICTED: uncharacterized protein LOC107803508 [Nicotiana tabacum]